MSMRDNIRTERYEEIEGKDESGNPIVNKVKVIQRTYPCRPQVIERKEKWVKFGNVKNIPRGQNEIGLFTINGCAKFVTDEGDLNEEIEIAQDLIEMGKKHQMSRQLRM